MGLDWGSGASGAAQGAAAGTAIVPGWGTVIGGVVGGAAGLLSGGKKKKKKLSTLDAQQQKLNNAQHESIFGKGPLADLYNYDPQKANSVFDKTVADPAYKKFNEGLAPGITGQFRKEGLQNSSYAGDALAKLAADIQGGLDAQRSQYLFNTEGTANSNKMNAIENLQNRNTQAVDANQGGGGFDINSLIGLGTQAYGAYKGFGGGAPAAAAPQQQVAYKTIRAN